MKPIEFYQSEGFGVFGWIQFVFIKVFAGSSTEAYKQEEDHYAALTNLEPKISHMEVIDYLYGRLNIIDQKSQLILTLNTISLGALTITFQYAEVHGKSVSVFGHPYLATAMFASSTMALALAFTLSRLRFDHISPTHGGSSNAEEYQKNFFSITIARQVMLSLARTLTALAFVFFSIMIVPRLLSS